MHNHHPWQEVECARMRTIRPVHAIVCARSDRETGFTPRFARLQQSAANPRANLHMRYICRCISANGGSSTAAVVDNASDGKLLASEREL